MNTYVNTTWLLPSLLVTVFLPSQHIQMFLLTPDVLLYVADLGPQLSLPFPNLLLRRRLRLEQSADPLHSLIDKEKSLDKSHFLRDGSLFLPPMLRPIQGGIWDEISVKKTARADNFSNCSKKLEVQNHECNGCATLNSCSCLLTSSQRNMSGALI